MQSEQPEMIQIVRPGHFMRRDTWERLQRLNPPVYFKPLTQEDVEAEAARQEREREIAAYRRQKDWESRKASNEAPRAREPRKRGARSPEYYVQRRIRRKAAQQEAEEQAKREAAEADRERARQRFYSSVSA